MLGGKFLKANCGQTYKSKTGDTTIIDIPLLTKVQQSFTWSFNFPIQKPA